VLPRTTMYFSYLYELLSSPPPAQRKRPLPSREDNGLLGIRRGVAGLNQAVDSLSTR